MKVTPTKIPKKIGKLSPIPVRLDPKTADELDTLSKRSGIPKAVIIRAAFDFSLPKMISGEVNILDGRK